jgi:hypothetical protein
MTKAPLGGKKDGQKPHGSSQTRHQTVSSGGGTGRADRTRGGRRKPSGHETRRADVGKHARRSARTDKEGTAALLWG